MTEYFEIVPGDKTDMVLFWKIIARKPERLSHLEFNARKFRAGYTFDLL